MSAERHSTQAQVVDMDALYHAAERFMELDYLFAKIERERKIAWEAFAFLREQASEQKSERHLQKVE